MTTRCLLFLAVLVLAPAPALAQHAPPLPPPPTQALTLHDALQRAHDEAPAVLAAIARVSASRAQVDITRSALWPTLSTSVTGSASITQSTSSSAPGSAGSGGTQSASTYPSALFGLTGSVNANWLIWDFGRTDEATRVARFEATATQQDLADARRAAMQAVGAAFFGVLADQQIVATETALVEQRRAELQIAQGLVEVGQRPPIEQTRAQVTLAAAQLDLSVAQGTFASDTAALAAALAFDPTTQVTVVVPEPLSVNDDPTAAADAAVRARPDVRAAQLRLDEARGSVRVARAGWMPTLSANAALTGRLNDSINTRGCSAITVTDPMTGLPVPGSTCTSGATMGTETTANGSATGSASVGITFSAPLVDESIGARIRASEAQADAQQASMQQLVLSVRSSAVQAAVSVRNARAALAQSEELARQAEANLAQARGRYESGAASYLELVDAEAADAGARITVVRLRAATDLARLQLMSATGRLERAPR